MNRFSDFTAVIYGAGLLLLAAVAPFSGAQATPFTVLHVFQGGSDGALPNGNLVVDGSGNFYGTTMYGGASNSGTVFKIDSKGVESILYSFGGGSDGALPQGAIVLDQSGNLFGTTSAGGASGDGTIFEISTATSLETVLWSFQAGGDGQFPLGGVILDQSGNLHGTTYTGGGACNCGTIFAWNSNDGESVSYSFAGGSDGANPSGGLVEDQFGNFYGTTTGGGGVGLGTVFELDTTNTETVLYAFQGGNDGAVPESGLSLDPKKTSFYGTTLYGGGSACSGSGCGTIFALSSALKETVLHAFQGVSVDGAFPVAAVTIDASGSLYGSTCGTGQSPPNCNSYAAPDKHCAKGCSNGDVFGIPGCCESSLDPAKGFGVIHRFNGKGGGSGPSAPMLLYQANFYGTTEYGGSRKCNLGAEPGCGIVFKLAP